MRDSAKEVFADQRTENRAKADAALDELRNLGCTVHSISVEERLRWIEATESLYAEFGSKSAKTAEMIQKIRDLA